MYKLKLCGEANVGLVEGYEEEGEYLVYIDEENTGLLIEFCNCIVSGLFAEKRFGVRVPSHSTLSTIRGDRILYQR